MIDFSVMSQLTPWQREMLKQVMNAPAGERVRVAVPYHDGVRRVDAIRRIAEVFEVPERLLGIEPAERVPWAELWPDARDDLLWWCQRHHIDPNRTPADPMIEFDETTGEWRIEQWHRPVRVVGDEVVSYVVRRVFRAPLPWPTRDPATWIR